MPQNHDRDSQSLTVLDHACTWEPCCDAPALIWQLACRSSSPIGDDVIQRVGSKFQAASLMEHAARARRLVIRQSSK